jgi:hypothetical protein
MRFRGNELADKLLLKERGFFRGSPAVDVAPEAPNGIGQAETSKPV